MNIKNVKRNDPCPCGSGKNYKDCCRKEDKKALIAKEKKKKDTRTFAIDLFREKPRGPMHWLNTNILIDEIIRDNLPDALIIKYRPEDWISQLYQIYFILRSHYWFNFYFNIIRQEENTNESLMKNLLRMVKIETPLYIRIIAFFLRIIIDRVGKPEYDNLPYIPPLFKLELEYQEIVPFDYPGYIFKYVDKITNNVSKEINKFFVDARGSYNKDIKEAIFHDLYLPIPYYEIPKLQNLTRELRLKYIREPPKLDNSLNDESFIGKIIKESESSLEDESKELKNLFEDFKSNLSSAMGELSPSIKYIDRSKISELNEKVYSEMLRITKKGYEKMRGDFWDQPIFIDEKMELDEKRNKDLKNPFLQFLEDPIFKKEILCKLVDLLKRIYIELAKNENITENENITDIEEICDFYYFFFKTIKSPPQKTIFSDYNDLKLKLFITN